MSNQTENRMALIGIPEADAYVRNNVRFVQEKTVYGKSASFLRCIDGRRSDVSERVGPSKSAAGAGYISFPGGGLGVVGLILSALQTSFIRPWKEGRDPRAQTAEESFAFERVIKILERAMGGMSGHTDEHNASDASACAGCGHVRAMLAGGYGLGEIYRTALEHYTIDLKKRAERGEAGIEIDLYRGTHEETAVLRVKSNLDTGEFVSIIPTDGTASVFVFNEIMDQKILTDVGGILYEELVTDFKTHGISKDEFLAVARSFYFGHMRSSAFKLAHDLPVYDVLHPGRGHIELRHSVVRY
jgi:hypothetical protein